MSQESAIVDKLLTGVSNAHIPHGFIAEQILTPLSVAETTGKIGKYGNSHLRIISNTKIVGKGKYPMVSSQTRLSDTYDVETHGLFDIITPKEYRNVSKPFDIESDVTRGLTGHLQLGKEKALADALFDTSIITQNTTLTGNAQYNNLTHADSDPLGDALVARSAIRDKIGHAPNIAIMSGKTFDTLSYHAQILDKLGFKDNRAGSLSNEELARALGVKEVLVGEAMYNAAKEGQADNLQPIWGTGIVYAYREKKSARYQKTLGYDVTLSAGKLGGRRTVQKWNETMPRGAKGVSVDDSYDQLLSDTECAYLIKNAIA